VRERHRRLALLVSNAGVMATEPGRTADGFELQSVVLPLTDRLMQPAHQGALPQLRAATDPSLPTGTYVGPGGPARCAGCPWWSGPRRPRTTRSSPWGCGTCPRT
jgi:hypothetical protein